MCIRDSRKAAAPASAETGQRVASLYFPEKGKKTQIVPGSAAEAAKELVRRLREEARAL